jgi:amidase
MQDGRISLEVVMPLAPSFDTVGWFARDPALFVAGGG